MKKPNLVELQRWFHWAITRPGPESTDGEPAPRCAEQVIGTLEVYRNAYFSRIAEALEADFPITRWVLGPDAFRGLVMRYLARHPSHTTNIGEVGKHLAPFLGEDEQGVELPFLTDLARLEWLQTEVFYSETLPLLDATALARLPEEAWAAIRPRLDPSARVFESPWPLLELRARWLDRGDADEASPEALELGEWAERALVFRHPSRGVEIAPLTGEQLRLARLFEEGTALGDAIDGFEDPSWVPGTLADWVRKGIIRVIDFEGAPS